MKPVVLSIARIPDFLIKHLHQEFNFHEDPEKKAPASFEALAKEARALVGSGTTKLTREQMAKFPKLEIISLFGVGFDGIDLEAAKERGIIVANTPGVLTEDVADLAMALMLDTARKIAQSHQFVIAGSWPKGSFGLARKVSGARLGIIGLGRIGQAIAKRASGFDMSISYTDLKPIDALDYTFYATPKELAANVDFLIVASTGGASTQKLVNREVIDALGPNGYLINIARGSIVDEEELVAALVEKRIAGAGIDAFVDEPNVPAALFKLDNVVLTPHIASATLQTRMAMADFVFANLEAHFSGKPIPARVV